MELAAAAETQSPRLGCDQRRKSREVPQGEEGLGRSPGDPGQVQDCWRWSAQRLDIVFPLQNRVWPNGQQEHLTKDNGDSSAGECSPHPVCLHLSVPGITLLGDSFSRTLYSLIHTLTGRTTSPILSFRKLRAMLQNQAVQLSLTVLGPAWNGSP